MSEPNSGLKIGQVAKRAGVSVETLRYYEQRGLLASPRRTPAGYREYPEQVLQQLTFISRAKDLGFSLSEIGELLQLQLNPEADRAEVKQLVVEKLVLIEQRLAELQQLRLALQRLSSSCDGQGGVDQCPIMAFLQQGDCEAEAGACEGAEQGDGKK